MSPGVQFTLYTARVAALLYAAGIALLLAGPKYDQSARLVWTLGCAVLWVHVAAAFQFIHHWSHSDALRFTAEQTAAMTGIRGGAGIYLNYLFMLAWAVDCAFWWMAGLVAYRRRRRAVTLTLHAFLLFMMFNATVIFAGGLTRYIGIMVFVCLGLLLIARWRQLWSAREAFRC